MENNGPKTNSFSDPFWDKIEMMFLESIFIYICKHKPKNEQNMATVVNLIKSAEYDSDDASSKSELDKMFDCLANSIPNSQALQKYQMFKTCCNNHKLFKNIYFSVRLKFNLFFNSYLSSNHFDLNFLNKEKSALFIIPASINPVDYLVPLIYTNLFTILNVQTKFFISKVDNEKTLPVLFLTSVLYDKNFSCNVILNDISQFKKYYKNTWDSILSNLDCLLILDTSDTDCIQHFKEKYLEPDDMQVFSDKIFNMTNDECILKIRGYKPVIDKKHS
jgi:type IV secretion system protein VirD4